MSRACVDCKWYAPNFDPPRKWWQLASKGICRNPNVKQDPVNGGPDAWESTCQRQRVFEDWPGCCNERGKWFEAITKEQSS